MYAPANEQRWFFLFARNGMEVLLWLIIHSLLIKSNLLARLSMSWKCSFSWSSCPCVVIPSMSRDPCSWQCRWDSSHVLFILTGVIHPRPRMYCDGESHGPWAEMKRKEQSKLVNRKRKQNENIMIMTNFSWWPYSAGQGLMWSLHSFLVVLQFWSLKSVA